MASKYSSRSRKRANTPEEPPGQGKRVRRGGDEKEVQKVTTGISLDNSLELLLIGKTGSGKSATGNSILNRKAFEVFTHADSGTEEAQLASRRFPGEKEIFVVDTPGLFDTILEGHERLPKFTNLIKNDVFPQCQDGFNALLLVIQYGQRATPEEKDNIELFRQFFGRNVIKEHTVCVITRGDEFKKKSDISCQEYFENQSGFWGKIFEECNKRCVLFDNDSKNQQEKDDQLKELIAQVNKLKSKGRKYDPEVFQEAKNERDAAIKRKAMPNLGQEYSRKIARVHESIDLARKRGEGKKNTHNINQIKSDIKSIISELQDEPDLGLYKLLAEQTLSKIDSIQGKKSYREELAGVEKMMNMLNIFRKCLHNGALVLQIGGVIVRLMSQHSAEAISESMTVIAKIISALMK